jgi:putative transposase
MARPLRIEYAGAYYHVMARGNQGQVIFRDDKDRVRFLETLAEACEKTGWRVHAYVLMGNHYHLLLETPEANLVAGMKWLQGAYTQRFNGRHKIRGHLFQGRYKAVVVDGQDPNYLQVVSTYIHLNPARAGLVKAVKEALKRYRWSSYPWYLSRHCPVWLCRAVVMASVRLEPNERSGYAAYINSRVMELGIKAGKAELEEKWKEVRRGWYLGGEKFLDKLDGWLERAISGRRRESQSGGARRAHDERTAEKLIGQGLAALDWTEVELKSKGLGAMEKVVLAWWLRRTTTVGLRWVSDRLVMGHYTRVTQAMSRAQRQPTRAMKVLMKRLETMQIN